jgi:hypothetical protein
MPVAEERGVTKPTAKVCPCEACKKGRYEPNKIASLDIHSYNSRPRSGWVKQSTPDQRAENTPMLFMGVELETAVQQRPYEDYNATLRRERLITAEAFRIMGSRHYPHPQPVPRFNAEGDWSDEYVNWRRESQRWDTRYYETYQRLEDEGFARPNTRKSGNGVIATAEEAVSFAEPVGFWHAKHDGSVSGPEFASLPGSLEYWYSIRTDLDRMFTGLLHAGVRSHKGDTAGMHISMSVEAFVDSEHLIRFAKLVNSNPRWSQRMSQRTTHSLSWCHIGQDTFAPGAMTSRYTGVRRPALEQWAEEVMEHGSTGGDRYNAINASCGDGRIEFRLPRGTLRIDRFYKNLEWVASMVEFTRDFTATDSATYMRWVMGKGAQWGDLKSWFEEKFDLVDTRDGFEPERAVRGGRPNRFAITLAASALAPARPAPAPYYEDEYEEPYDFDEPEDSAQSCVCGLTHDLPLESYEEYPWNATPAQAHIYYDGSLIGPMRNPEALSPTARQMYATFDEQVLEAALPAGEFRWTGDEWSSVNRTVVVDLSVNALGEVVRRNS